MTNGSSNVAQEYFIRARELSVSFRVVLLISEKRQTASHFFRLAEDRRSHRLVQLKDWTFALRWLVVAKENKDWVTQLTDAYRCICGVCFSTKLEAAKSWGMTVEGSVVLSSYGYASMTFIRVN